MKIDLVRCANQPSPFLSRSSPMRSGALASPTPHRGWIDPEQGGGIHRMRHSIHRGQGSLTDVV